MKKLLIIASVVIGLAAASVYFLFSLGKANDMSRYFTFISSEEVDTLDPQGTSWMQDFRIIECIYEPLLRLPEGGGDPEPGVAARYEVSGDLRTYTFHFRSDAKWSNGDAVRPDDFIYAWRRAMAPDFAADYSGMFLQIKGAKDFYEFRKKQLADYHGNAAAHSEDAAKAAWRDAVKYFAKTVGLKAVDDKTLVVELERPIPYFPQLAAFPAFCPIHVASYEKTVAYDKTQGIMLRDSAYFTDNKRVVCNGPYVIADYKAKDKTLLLPNKHYWNSAKLANAGICVRIVTDPKQALMQYENGDVDWWPDMSTAVSMTADLLAARRRDTHQELAAGTYFFVFNCEKEVNGKRNPLADARVRRALSMAVDRKVIVEQITRLKQPIAKTFVPEGLFDNYRSPVEAGTDFNPEGARQLLADAGYPAGKGLTGMSILYNTNGGHENVAERVRHDWQAHLGIIVSLEGVEKSTFRDRRRKQAFEVARAGWYGDYRDPTTFLDMFKSTDDNNDGRYSNAEYDALLAKAAEEPDSSLRMALLAQAETLLLNEQPLMPLYRYTTVWMFDPDKVTGLTMDKWQTRRLEFARVKGK